MAKKIEKKSTEEKKKLTVHGLLGSLSYWGTTARFMLVSVFIVFAFILNLTGDNSASYIDSEIMFFIVGLTTLLALDLGYTVAARGLPLNRKADRWAVMISDSVLAGFFVAPSMLHYIGGNGDKVRIAAILLALLVVALRVLVGLLFTKRKR